MGWGVISLLTVAVHRPAAVQGQTEMLDRIRAIVDGHVIMQSDIQASIDLQLVATPTGPEQDAAVLTHLIERRLILDRVDRFAVAEPTPDAVDRRLEDVRRRLAGDAEFTATLNRVGFTLDDLRQLMADDIRRDRYLADRFAVVGDARRAQATADWVADLVRRAQVRRVSGVVERAAPTRN